MKLQARTRQSSPDLIKSSNEQQKDCDFQFERFEVYSKGFLDAIQSLNKDQYALKELLTRLR
jgi:hypothetical protein